MRDIVERLRFDAVRCKLQLSKGIANNIEEGIAEIERLRRDCAELYQVVGVLAEEAGLFEDREVTKALDNANAAANGLPCPHKDILPFAPPSRYGTYEEARRHKPRGACYCNLDDRACFEAGHWANFKPDE